MVRFKIRSKTLLSIKTSCSSQTMLRSFSFRRRSRHLREKYSNSKETNSSNKSKLSWMKSEMQNCLPLNKRMNIFWLKKKSFHKRFASKLLNFEKDWRSSRDRSKRSETLLEDGNLNHNQENKNAWPSLRTGWTSTLTHLVRQLFNQEMVLKTEHSMVVLVTLAIRISPPDTRISTLHVVFNLSFSSK